MRAIVSDRTSGARSSLPGHNTTVRKTKSVKPVASRPSLLLRRVVSQLCHGPDLASFSRSCTRHEPPRSKGPQGQRRSFPNTNSKKKSHNEVSNAEARPVRLSLRDPLTCMYMCMCDSDINLHLRRRWACERAYSSGAMQMPWDPPRGAEHSVRAT